MLSVTVLLLIRSSQERAQNQLKMLDLNIIRLNIFTANAICACFLPYQSDYLKLYANAGNEYFGPVGLASNLIGAFLGIWLGSVADARRCHRKLYAIVLTLVLAGLLFLLVPIYLKQNEATHDSEQLEQPNKWFCPVALDLVFLSMAIVFCSNLSDTYCSDMATKCQTTYGRIRMFGGIGFAAASLTLYLFEPSTTHMVTCLVVANLLLVLMSPSGAFDLSKGQDSDELASILPFETQSFKMRNTIGNCYRELELLSPCELISNQQLPISMTKMDMIYEFDPESYESAASKRARIRKKKRFVTTIEISSDTTTWTSKEVDGHESETAIRKSNSDLRLTNNNNNKDPIESANEHMDMRIHLIILFMMLKRNKLFVRFLVIYFIGGLSQSSITYYLAPFLQTINATHYIAMSAMCMFVGYTCETLFYLVSPKITPLVSFSATLSIILAAFSLKFVTYFTFSLLGHELPWHLILITEILQAITSGWFNCVFFVSAQQFSLEAEVYMPELVEAGLIKDDEQTRENIRNGFKVTMVSISSCSFDGLGMAFGSLIGGLISWKFGYPTFWAGAAICVSSASVVNMYFHLAGDGRSPV